MVFFLVGGGAFFGIFFNVFKEILELNSFIKVDNCQINGKLTKNLESIEQYSIVYVNFKYDDVNYLGYACESDENRGRASGHLTPYKFIYYNDEYT